MAIAANGQVSVSWILKKAGHAEDDRPEIADGTLVPPAR
ncbi:hypothetical protein EZJ58_1395 [Sodalis ligni]|uniref:Uncharacterized protein n=1 Tax=Sodalis ligni TaxID=2697027 RepID=A0A4R1N814_9GAMM|nr:hypothetical protein EZJ58_1395 [Sodalis ligni]